MARSRASPCRRATCWAQRRRHQRPQAAMNRQRLTPYRRSSSQALHPRHRQASLRLAAFRARSSFRNRNKTRPSLQRSRRLRAARVRPIPQQTPRRARPTPPPPHSTRPVKPSAMPRRKHGHALRRSLATADPRLNSRANAANASIRAPASANVRCQLCLAHSTIRCDSALRLRCRAWPPS